MNYALTFELEYEAQFLHAQMSDIVSDMQSSWLFQHSSLSRCCTYSWITKLFLKGNNVFRFATEQGEQRSGGHDLGLVPLDNPTVFSSIGEDSKLVVEAADSCMNSPTLSSSFPVQSF